MISVWLLFWRLLRATAGVKRANGNELNEGSSSNTVNQEQKEQEYQSATVTMETSQLSETGDLMDYKMDLGQPEDKNCQLGGDERECFHTFFSECLETTESPILSDEEPQDKGKTNELHSSESAGESDTDNQAQEDSMIKEPAQEESNSGETVISPESEAHHHTDDQAEGRESNDATESDHAKETPHQVLQEGESTIQESLLEQQITEQAISDVSTESCQDLNRDDLSDCLQVEMAIISSDSDNDEQLNPNYSAAPGKEEAVDEVEKFDGDTQDDPDHDISAVTESNASSAVEPECGAQIIIDDNMEILEQPECPTECELQDISFEASDQYHNLSKIPEDEEEHSQNLKRSTQPMSISNPELNKKVPEDYCVIQETKSENVSTEHVDFRVARKQWLKMEEQTKGQIRQTPPRQGTCQGGHSFMYTPVRNIDRIKRDPDLDSLGLGDYQYTQFSPCSEDSGLDDTSYRSPYDDSENPIEREIRQALEREENFKRERVMSKQAPTTQVKSRPGTLHTGKFERGLCQQVEDKRRMLDTREDRYRSQRSPGAKTPTFNVSASPSSRGPTYHEMTANNVIILEPDSYPTSPRQPARGSFLSPGSRRCHEWPSEMTNVIILETSNLIIRSASEFCLSTASQDTQESTFQNNPFFKLRSRSTQSLVDQEIKIARQREEELRRQRAQLYTKEKYDTVLVSPNLLETFSYDRSGELPAKSKSSPSSPSKIRKMDRSVLSCDQKFPEAPSPGARQKSPLVQRWEARMFANHEQN